MRGRLTGIQLPFRAKFPQVTFEVEAGPEALEKYQGKELEITVKQYRKKRSIDANACLWGCLGKIAEAVGSDNWSIYLYMLERYGKFTHLLVAPEAVDAVRLQWRETKVVGEVMHEGRKMTQMLCFFGSSTYDSKEFSRLLDGVISEMKAMHLETPADTEMRAIIADIERREHERSKQTGACLQKQGGCG